MAGTRDHGGGLDAAAQRWGGARAGWIDLSTGINPLPYPIADLPADCWTALPDSAATARLETAARDFWGVPDGAEIVIAPGASALIARLPAMFSGRTTRIPGPTYNEHAAAFAAAGWQVSQDAPGDVTVVVHPNNPDGRLWTAHTIGPAAAAVIIDESFADISPERSLIGQATRQNRVVLKSFGKFWGLAGMRLGFAICAPDMAARLRDALGPWPVSGPALEIGARALENTGWARQTRTRLAEDAQRLDALMQRAGAAVAGGTPLFRLYDVGDAAAWQDRFARARIWTRVFPYSDRWLRLGLPHPDHWPRIEAALA